jgi:glycogen debranching enzyme
LARATSNNTFTFFQELATLGSDKWIRGVKGTCRFDITGFGSRYLIMDDGNLSVIESTAAADAIICGDVAEFDRLIRERRNLLTTYLQGRISYTGSLALFFAVQRLFPCPDTTDDYSSSLSEHLTTTTPPQSKQESSGLSSSAPVPTVSMLNGSTFVVSDLRGDMDASPTNIQGLFSRDTRHLSRWKLTINGIVPNILATDDLQYHSMQFFLVPTTGTVYIDATLSLIRTRTIGEGFHEQLRIFNHANQGVDLDVQIEVGADFADIFEIKDALQKKGHYSYQIAQQQLTLSYRRESFKRETCIECSLPVTIKPDRLSMTTHIEPHGNWIIDLDIMVADMETKSYPLPHQGHEKAALQQQLDAWIEAAPQLESSWLELERIYRQSLIDLAALRFFSKVLPGESLPAAGLPWFMAVFGRDSLITSFQTLPFIPGQAMSTLRVLANRQGFCIDNFRDEEPGKITHEMRLGEMTAFEERPHSPYYGSADATPLFLILLDEMERWTGNTQLVKQLEWNARAALEWIDVYGDRNHDGYIEYDRRNKATGLENQGWKDSWNAILFADGSNSRLPRSLCEIQGYVYDAKKRCARLARKIWNDPALAERLEREAAELKHRFNQDFWLADKGYFALAIDGDGRKVDALTSNIGHLIWSGIVNDDKIASCVQHLMSDRLFSGWGIRTMAAGEGGYNPIGYHVGAVWPHDNSLIALGLAQHNYHQEAARLSMGILQTATYFNNRLPEAFAGYERKLTEYPVEYPTACSPQAWATGTPLLLLRAMLGLEPIENHLIVNPHLPEFIGWLKLFNIPGRWGKMDVYGRGKLIDTDYLY